MSQQDNFSSGFFWGAVFGGIAGGVVGALLVNKAVTDGPDESAGDEVVETDASLGASRRRPLRISAMPERAIPERNMEVARQSLEDKIASLNDAIDDVRQQLRQVNGGDRSVPANSTGADDRSIRRDGPEETS
jgi:hypothetical protein